MKRILMLMLIMILSTSNVFGASQWTKTAPAGDTNVSDLDTNIATTNNEALDRMFTNYRDGVEVVYASSSTITVSAGEISCSNAAGSVRRFRKNTSATTVDITSNTYWDTGAANEQASTQYYLYGLADTDATTFTVIISTTASTPTGTYYKRIGSFYNDGSSNINRTKVYNQPYRPTPTDSSGIPIITAIYDYGTSGTSFTAKFSNLKIAVGTRTDSNAGSSAVTITNLPFSSATTYYVTCTLVDADGTISTCAVTKNSGSQFSLYNTSGSSQTMEWQAIGI